MTFWCASFDADLGLVEQMPAVLRVRRRFRQQQLHGEVAVAVRLDHFEHLRCLPGLQQGPQPVAADRLSLTSGHRGIRSPVLFEVDVALELRRGDVDLEAALLPGFRSRRSAADSVVAPVSLSRVGTPIIFGLPHRKTCVFAGSSGAPSCSSSSPLVIRS